MSRKEFSTRTIEGYKGPDRIGIPNEINEKIVTYLALKQKKGRPSEELPYKMSKERAIKVKRRSETKEKVIINCLTCFSAVFDWISPSLKGREKILEFSDANALCDYLLGDN